MARQQANTKLKTLHVMKFFMENTNVNRTASANDVIEYLEGFGLSAERKSIYKDIEVLNKFGIKIVKAYHGFYYKAG